MGFPNFLSNKNCKYCECLVNEYVDNRLTKKKEDEFLTHIEKCAIIKNCTKCKELIEEFKKNKNYCSTLCKNLIMPKDLNEKLLKLIK